MFQNSCQQKFSPTVSAGSRSMSQSDNRKGGKIKPKKPFMKTQPFYIGQGIKKGK